MPHIIVEHTRDVEDVMGLLNSLHDSLAEQETVVMDAIKTRSIALDNVVVGNREKSSMVHVVLRLLPGRSDELRLKMASDLENVVKDKVSESTSVTVETAELHKESYRN